MFVMMNAARLSVGLEGYAVAERAFQQAADWARTRVQGKPPGVAPVAGSVAASAAPIIHHPDVKRMLLGMRSQIEALRAVALYAAHQLDLGGKHPDPAVRAAAHARGDLLIPVVKGCSTEAGIEIASTGLQVHGGMGFIEETGAAQPYRDVRITTIYEGTTGIQSNDFVGRKIVRDRGVTMAALIADARRELAALDATEPAIAETREAAVEAIAALEAAVQHLLGAAAQAPDRAFAVSVPLLRLAGLALGGWMLAKSAGIAARKLAAGSSDADFLRGKIAAARFHAAHVLPQAQALSRTVIGGGASVLDVDAALI
jgi:hypothetical protein